MKTTSRGPTRSSINRRAFLRGAGAGGAIAIGLPFLEGLPSRSAWAQDSPPVFGFFVVAACGVVGNQFWPGSTGALDSASMTGKAIEPLAPYASKLLMVNDTRYPGGSASACGHAQGLCQALTGIPPQGSGPTSSGGGISADQVIASAVNANGADPWNLYSGAKSYIAERVSFKGAGTAAPAELNPYVKFQTLMGVEASTGGTVTPGTPTSTPSPTVVDEQLVRRKSVNDFVRAELESLRAQTRLSAGDQARLEQHFESVRQIELDMVSMGEMMAVTNPPAIAGCSTGNLDQAALEAMSNLRFTQNGNMIEDIVKLHFQVVALAFACNANRVAALQWGDGTDGTLYEGISGPGWPFHQLSHRINSDGAVGNNKDAETAHAEVDRIRMTTLAAGLQHFEERGLLENSFVYWTTHVSDGPSHSFNNLPVIIAGSAGGKLKQGEYIEGGGADNSKVLSTLIETTGASAAGFGDSGGETLSEMLA
jgi:Protein of unknown function (DUF1552)